MNIKLAIAAVVGVFVLWTVVATVLWATGDTGTVLIETKTVTVPAP